MIGRYEVCKANEDSERAIEDCKTYGPEAQVQEIR